MSKEENLLKIFFMGMLIGVYLSFILIAFVPKIGQREICKNLAYYYDEQFVTVSKGWYGSCMYEEEDGTLIPFQDALTLK